MTVSQTMEVLALSHHKFKGFPFTSNKVIFRTASASCKSYFLYILWHLHICEKQKKEFWQEYIQISQGTDIK